MPLIEGVGDEVVQFVATVLAILVVALAWWSTNARLERYRAVVVMRSSRPHHPITVSIRSPRPPNVYPSSATEPLEKLCISDKKERHFGMKISSSSTPITEVLREGRRVIPLQEMDSIVDADMAMMNHHRLHFYRRVSSPTNDSAAAARVEADTGGAGSEPAAQAQMREMDSIVSAMEADDAPFPRAAAAAESTTTNSNETTKAQEIMEGSQPAASTPLEGATSAAPEQNTTAAQSGDAKRILIKLKYLNDELKEVEGSLDEMLKDFTWRHFSSELAAESRVRLIFRGRVLGDASATLRALGLHHRATVHALVHPRRALAPPSPGAAAGASEAGELVEAAAAAERSWDLENILMTLVSVALTVVWFFRCEYSNMFTASASVALFGLTVFYSVAIFGLYLSDTFHFDRRPAQAQPIPDN